MENTSKKEVSVVDTSGLQYPLPEEIRKMARDDTVCKFCGVSYLIHNEIKNLEDKLKNLEKELAHYKGMEEREENLKYELRKVNMDLSASQNTVAEKDAIIETLNAQIKAQDDNIGLMTQNKQTLETKLADKTQQAETYRLKHNLFLQNLPSVVSSLQSHRQTYQSLIEHVKERDKFIVEECKNINTEFSQKCSKLEEEYKKINANALVYKQQLEDCQKREVSLKEEISNLSSNSEQLSQLQSQYRESQFENELLKGKLQNVEKELETTISSSRSSTMEAEQFRDQLKKQSQDVEKIQSQFRSREQQLQQLIDQSKKEFNQKEFELDSVRRDLSNMRRKIEENERREQDMQQKFSSSSVKMQEMKEQLQRAMGDLEAIKKEREMMINAHQNQIEQLRESFKRRVAEADKWPERLEATIQKERQKHIAEMDGLECKLKENFVLELQIEKDKHRELMERYKSEMKENEQKLRSQLNTIGGKHNSEIGDLHRQIAETKARSREVENMLRKEVENLKAIIRDLESRLGKVQDGGSPEKLLGVKTQLIETQTELENKKQENKKLENQLSAAKEDIHFLQETVRRECEERLELTEALSQCKEDLLAYRKPPGGYPPRPGSSSSADVRAVSSGSSVASRSEEVMLFRKVSRQPQPPHPPKAVSSARDTGLSGGREVSQTPSVAVGYEGGTARSTGKGMRGGTVVEQRKRIAQAVGRK